MSWIALAKLTARLTHVPDHVPMKDRRTYTAGIFGIGICIAAHATLIVLFGLAHVPLMFYYNFISMLVFVFLLFLIVKQRTYTLVTILATGELFMHQLLAVRSVGLEGGFQLVFFAVMMFPFLLMPARRIGIAFGISVISLMTLLGLEISLKDAVPLYAIDRSSMLLLKNAVFLFMGLALTGMTYYFIVNVWKAEAKAAFEFERAESLLRNILPSSIAERLKDSPTTIADGFDRATVLFTDIVDFTKLAEKLSPAEVVAVLNDLFSRFDIVAEKHGLEKIKTIGDAYMVASGIPERCEDDAHSIAEFALDIQEEVRAFNAERCLSVEIRVGINSGPVVAGVIGRKKFIYDLWGDAVNMASRMESHGLPGRIQVAEGTRRLLADDFELESRGVIEVKGKGQIPAWLLNGRKAKAVR